MQIQTDESEDIVKKISGLSPEGMMTLKAYIAGLETGEKLKAQELQEADQKAEG